MSNEWIIYSNAQNDKKEKLNAVLNVLIECFITWWGPLYQPAWHLAPCAVHPELAATVQALHSDLDGEIMRGIRPKLRSHNWQDMNLSTYWRAGMTLYTTRVAHSIVTNINRGALSLNQVYSFAAYNIPLQARKMRLLKTQWTWAVQRLWLFLHHMIQGLFLQLFQTTRNAGKKKREFEGESQL